MMVSNVAKAAEIGHELSYHPNRLTAGSTAHLSCTDSEETCEDALLTHPLHHLDFEDNHASTLSSSGKSKVEQSPSLTKPHLLHPLVMHSEELVHELIEEEYPAPLRIQESKKRVSLELPQ